MIIFAAFFLNITIDVKQQLTLRLNVLQVKIKAIVNPVLNGDNRRTTLLHTHWYYLERIIFIEALGVLRYSHLLNQKMRSCRFALHFFLTNMS